MIKICIWQYRPSIHQSPLVRSLNNKCYLKLVIENDELSILRKKMGWSVNYEYQYNLISDLHSMKSFVDSLDDSFVHIFGGLRSSNNLRLLIKYLLKSGKRVFIQSEAPNYFGFKGVIVKLRTFLDYYLIYRKIEGVFAIGSLGLNFYQKILPSSFKIYPWAYFIDRIDFSKKESRVKFKIIYIGQLTRKKGVINILKALNQINLEFEFSIFGEGPELMKLKKFVSNNRKISNKAFFYNYIPNSDVQETISNYDLLILPSIIKDGWGVTVSEALSVGTPVIVSEKCGSSILISDPVRGSIVKSNNIPHLRNAIVNQIEKGKLDHKTRNEIVKWSNNLSPDKAAEFLIDCLIGKTVTAPWL